MLWNSDHRIVRAMNTNSKVSATSSQSVTFGQVFIATQPMRYQLCITNQPGIKLARTRRYPFPRSCDWSDQDGLIWMNVANLPECGSGVHILPTCCRFYQNIRNEAYKTWDLKHILCPGVNMHQIHIARFKHIDLWKGLCHLASELEFPLDF